MTPWLADCFHVFTPPPDLTVSQCADKYRVLSSESSAVTGRWNTDLAPYQRGVMDAVHIKGIQKIVMMGASQTVKTEAILNILLYFIAYDPAPIILMLPTLKLAKSFSIDRLAPMIRDSEILRGKIKETRTKDSNNTQLDKAFPGGNLTMVGSNSVADLSSRPKRIALIDEVDRCEVSAKEGDSIQLVQRRISNFYNALSYLSGSPTIKGASRIEQEFEQGDQRRYYVPCPECKGMHVLHFDNLKWDKVKDSEGKDTDEPDFKSAHMVCRACGVVIEEHHKHSMLLQGEWRAARPFKGVASFWINALYSPWQKWEKIVQDWYASKDNRAQLQVFFNTVLAETFEERGDAPEWQLIYLKVQANPHRHERGTVPDGGLILTAGIDIQKDRAECEVFAWGQNRRAWSVEETVIFGDPAGDELWDKIREWINTEWKTPGGSRKIRLTAIDTGGHWTQRVYMFGREMGHDRVMLVKGTGLDIVLGRPKSVDISFRGQQIKKGVQLWTVGTDYFKKEIYSLLRMEFDWENIPSGFVQYPLYDEEYFKQLTSEQLYGMKAKSGRVRYVFRKMRERNEALDRNVYARAAMVRLGVERFADRDWAQYAIKASEQPKVDINQLLAMSKGIGGINL